MEMYLKTALYHEQINNWPSEGKHVLAQFTDEYVVAYQAYKPAIADFAVKHQYFGGEFSFNRMSWIKTNFLWMMYRSGWGTKFNQERTLALYLKREYFDSILENAWPSSCPKNINHDEWKAGVARTNVRLQWDPDHDPYGGKEERRAVQLGLRADFLEPFKGEGLVRIEDISDFVVEQRKHVEARQLDLLVMPEEDVYPVADAGKDALGI